MFGMDALQSGPVPTYPSRRSLIFILIISRRPSSNGESILFLSQENIVRVLRADLGNDPQLCSAFNMIVLASIDNTVREGMRGHDFPLTENPHLRDDLSQEELEYLESEINKLMKS